MATYKIITGDAVINTIESDETFCKSYCEENGYTYELVEPPEVDPGEPAPTLESLSAENTKLKAQLKLQSEQQTFLEDCLLEMADVVYA